MVIKANERSAKKPAKQGVAEDAPEPIKIGASTPYDFDSKSLTAYGGLLPVATMLEKLKFRQLVEETLTVKRITRTMPWYQFVLSMVLALYVGFSRLHHLRFLARDPILKVLATAVHVLAFPTRIRPCTRSTLVDAPSALRRRAPRCTAPGAAPDRYMNNRCGEGAAIKASATAGQRRRG
jgi:hypothetical protein